MDQEARYCDRCGHRLDPESTFPDCRDGLCEEIWRENGRVSCYCPRCGDYLGEDSTHCSCDKQD